MKKERWLSLGIIVFAGVLRCLFLNRRSIQYDDAFSILLSSRSVPEIIQGTAADTMPPLYYLLLHFWQHVSLQLWFLRLLSIIFSLGIILFTFLLTKNLFGYNAGLAAAFLVGISPLQIYHAQDLRMYSLLAFNLMGYTWCLSELNNHGKFHIKPAWFGMVLFGTAALYSHNLAIYFIIIPNIYLLLCRQWRKLLHLIGAQTIIGLLAMPWLWIVPQQIQKIQLAFWTPRPDFVEIIQTLILVHATLPLPPVLIALALSISIFTVTMVIVELVYRKRGRSDIIFIACLAVLPPVLIFISSYIMRPVFVTRGFIASTVAYLVLAGVIISVKWEMVLGKIFVGGFILASLISLPYQLTYEQFPRSPFRQAMASLEENSGSSILVVHDNKLSFFPCKYFAPEFNQVFLADESGSSNDTLAPATQKALQLFPVSDIKTAVKGYQQIYFIAFDEALAEYSSINEQGHPNIYWLNQNYKLVDIKKFGDLGIYHYSL